jgi:hypothetical protein
MLSLKKIHAPSPPLFMSLWIDLTTATPPHPLMLNQRTVQKLDNPHSETLIHFLFSQNLVIQGDFMDVLFFRVKLEIHGVTHGVI